MLTRKPEIGDVIVGNYPRRGGNRFRVTGFHPAIEDIALLVCLATGEETSFIWRHPEGLNTAFTIEEGHAG